MESLLLDREIERACDLRKCIPAGKQGCCCLLVHVSGQNIISVSASRVTIVEEASILINLLQDQFPTQVSH